MPSTPSQPTRPTPLRPASVPCHPEPPRAEGSPAPLDYDALLDGAFFTPAQLQAQSARQAAEDALLEQSADDEGNAHCVYLRHAGRFLHNESFGWLAYTSGRWMHEGAEALLDRAIVDTLDARRQAAFRSGLPDQYVPLLRRCTRDNIHIRNAKALLRSKVYCPPSAFDDDPDLLNCPNGLVNLRTGDLLPHSPDQRFTACTRAAYQPEADVQPWLAWLTAAAGPDAAAWLQLAVGYTLTGHTREEVLFYLYGPSRSGKGVFLETLNHLLGAPLAAAVPFDLLTAPRDVDAQNFRLAPLGAARLVIANESNPYERFNEAKLKTLTGGDSIQAAFKGRDSFTFRPQFKIWLTSNQPVNADPDDEAVWGRLRLIAFPHSHLGQEDKGLKERLRTPPLLEAVLAWAVHGAVRWYRLGSAGLPELPGSARLKADQRSDLDHVAAWLDERCRHCDHCFTPSSDLYASYAAWCRDNGVEAKKLKGFAAALQRKAYRSDRVTLAGARSRGFYGLALA